MAQTARFVPTMREPKKTIVVDSAAEPYRGVAKALTYGYSVKSTGFIALTKKRRIEREAKVLQRRLIAGARIADADRGTDTTGMNDEQFLTLLRRR